MSLFWNYLYDIQYNGGACCSSVCNTIKLHTCGSFIYSKNDAAGCSARAHAPAETDWPATGMDQSLAAKTKLKQGWSTQ